jgi:hypothetical protein
MLLNILANTPYEALGPQFRCLVRRSFQLAVMLLFLFGNFCRYFCDGRLEMGRERNEIVLNY